MSRGLGKVQREILQLLESKGNWDFEELIVRTFKLKAGRMITESQYRSFRRAIANLRERGYEIGVEDD